MKEGEFYSFQCDLGHQLCYGSGHMPGKINQKKQNYTFVMANLTCQLDHMWNQLKPKHLGTPVKDFLDWIN